MVKALILLSGGLDSAVVLALAQTNQRECFALSFDYQQKHRQELEAAKAVAAYYGVSHQTISIDPTPFTSSSLVSSLTVPKAKQSQEIIDKGISNTYVPGRNTLFLAYAMSMCEALDLQEIHFGPSQADGACYPDCRSDYLQAVQQVFNRANEQGLKGHPIRLVTPLIDLNKQEIVKLGLQMQVPLELTWSCYSPTKDQVPCKECLACLLREEAFHLCKSL